MKKNKAPFISLPRPRHPGEYIPLEVVQGVWMGSKIELQEVGLWLDVGWENRNRHGFLLCNCKMLASDTLLSGNERSDETWGPTTTKTLSIQREDPFGTSSTQVRAGALGMRICYGVYGIRDKSASVT